MIETEKELQSVKVILPDLVESHLQIYPNPDPSMLDILYLKTLSVPGQRRATDECESIKNGISAVT